MHQASDQGGSPMRVVPKQTQREFTPDLPDRSTDRETHDRV